MWLTALLIFGSLIPIIWVWLKYIPRGGDFDGIEIIFIWMIIIILISHNLCTFPEISSFREKFGYSNRETICV